MAVYRHERGAIVLRPMTQADLPTVMTIERRAFAQPWSQAFFEKEMQTTCARLTVAVDPAAPSPALLGYTCRWVVADEVHLLNVAVHPDRRGTGVGRRLVEEVIAEGRHVRARAMFLEVRAGNVVARRLYRTLGFRDLGIRRGYYGPGQDAIVMELRLDLP
ncbi:MAG: ribosomal protein S18-alanine N-acetyltransferase [bacterium]|nr:ribosomal protein S18-alanine N-acetyltransferase [bacterium]